MCSHEQDKEAGDDPEIEDILKACCSWRRDGASFSVLHEVRDTISL
jgi:hypothetical protein